MPATIETPYRTRCLLPRTERSQCEVTLITAAMFAGKTTELMERCFRHQLAGRTVRLLKPVTDDRYSASHVASHRGLRVECERKCSGGPRIQVGGAELYEPACRACWEMAMEGRRGLRL